MSHYCIANPCWICYPQYAPKSGEKYYEFWKETIKDHYIPETGISGKVKNLLIEVFKAGLNEDAHEYEMSVDQLSYQDLLKEIKNIKDGMLEAELLSLLIDDLKPIEELK